MSKLICNNGNNFEALFLKSLVHSCKHAMIINHAHQHNKGVKKFSIRCQAFITHLPPIDRGQTSLTRPYPGGLVRKAAAGIQMLDPKTTAGHLTTLETHGQHQKPLQLADDKQMG